MREREVIQERPVEADREVIIDERPPRGGGGGVVAAVIGIILVLIIGWVLLNALGVMDDAAENSGGGEVQVEVPNFDVEGGEGGGEGGDGG